MGEMEESGSLRCAEAVLGLENPPLARRGDIRVKVAANTETKHNPTEEPCWVSCLRENFTSSSYGEELETGPAARSGTAPVPYPTEKWTTQSPPNPHRLGASQHEASRLTQTCVQRTGCGTLGIGGHFHANVAAPG